MRKLLKSRKALSPVVAAIILIAVTVAVSIAVAAWMGALTFTFMKTEELKITSHEWTASNEVTLYVTNTGTATLSIDYAEINSVRVTPGFTDVGGGATDGTLDPGDSVGVTISPETGDYSPGVKYEFAVATVTGGRYTFMAVAPS